MNSLYSGLFVSFCILVTLTYLCSLTYTHHRSRLLLLVRYVVAAGSGIILMAYAVPLNSGVIVDLRLVPIALTGLLGGFWPALAVALPIAAYRVHLGGPGTLGGLGNLLVALVVSSALRPHFRHTPGPWRAWWAPWVIAGAADLTLLMVPRVGMQLFQQAYAPLMVAHAASLTVALGVLHLRLLTLRQASTLQRLAYRDPLTGAGNRRQMIEDIRDAPPQGTYLLALDLDHFKQVNDTHGHPFGDRVLNELVQVLRGTLRDRDGVYRVGGEEFVVVLRDCQEGVQEQVAHRLREAVAARLARQAGQPERSLTVSVGLARFTGDLDGTLALADERLYEAKAAGRNCVRGEPGVLRRVVA